MAIINLNSQFESSGTRFKVFPQSRHSPFSHHQPEVIYVSTPPAKIQPGPADNKFKVVDAFFKNQFYNLWKDYMPPYQGRCYPPVPAGADGHFDHLDHNYQDPTQDGRPFNCAATFATARRVLDMWEAYAGHTVQWISDLHAGHLEVIPFVENNGALSGYGRVEFGYYFEGAGPFCRLAYGPGEKGPQAYDRNLPNCENFDIVAHEVGHNILFAEVDAPTNETATLEYYAFHEATSDLIAILASLHFNSMIESVLEYTKGNLYGQNELSAIMEMPRSGFVRMAFNDYRLPLVSSSESPNYAHSRVLTGAIFDILVEVFQDKLIQSKAISEELARRSEHQVASNTYDSSTAMAIQAEFERAYLKDKEKFQTALLEARDYVGFLVARTVNQLTPDYFSFFKMGTKLLATDREISAGRYQQLIRDGFNWRGITPKRQETPEPKQIAIM